MNNILFPSLISGCPRQVKKTAMNGSNAFKNPSETIPSTKSFPIKRLQSDGAAVNDLLHRTPTKVKLVEKREKSMKVPVCYLGES